MTTSPRVAEAPSPRALSSSTPIVAAADLERLIAGYRDLLPIGPGVEPGLAAALREVLSHPGNMIRAQLAFALLAESEPVADGERGEDAGVRVATALEYFHAASLIFDDLPAMDDATLRRGRPCPHRVWGEGIAILAALALVNRAYDLVWSVISALPPRRRREAGELVAACLGVDGILGGQARDLGFTDAAHTVDAAVAVADGKTVSLIRLTLVLPAIIAGAPLATREQLGDLARRWGLSYQILDDFRDRLQGVGETGKSGRRDEALDRPNLPRLAGSRRALGDLTAHLAAARAILEGFPRSYPPAEVVSRVQAFLEQEAARVLVALDAVSAR